MIQGHYEEGNEEVQPYLHLHMCNHPPESQDQDAEASESNSVNAIRGKLGDKQVTLQDEKHQGNAVAPKVMVPGVVGGGLEAQDGGIEVPMMVQPEQIET